MRQLTRPPSSALKLIVNDYIRRIRPCAEREINCFRDLPDLVAAIHHASMCHKSAQSKRHPHQYRIPAQVLKRAEQRLQKRSAEIARSTTFEDLYALIDGVIRPRENRLKGIGDLTVYDISRRIGAFLRLQPKLVYLHRGTLTGARPLGLRGDTLDPAQLPKEFAKLTPAEIEDCLCIYADVLASPSSDPAARIRSCVTLKKQRNCRPVC